MFWLAVAATALGGPTASAQLIVRASVDSSGAQTSGPSFSQALSSDGRIVAFESNATDLVAGDTNGTNDIFVRDLAAGTTERVSVSTGGGQASGTSYLPSLSGDGRLVTFLSTAPNLVPGDLNSKIDAFLHDRATGKTVRLSVGPAGVEANGDTIGVRLASGGGHALLTSFATNLVPVDVNGEVDVFLRDLSAGTTELVSVATGGAQGDEQSGGAISISRDGRLAAFSSFATNLVAAGGPVPSGIYVRDRALGTTSLVSVSSAGTPANSLCGLAEISDDGTRVAFSSFATNLVPADANGFEDVFVHEVATGITARVSVSSTGAEGNAHSGFHGISISGNGGVVVFESLASNLVPDDTNFNSDVFVHDTSSGETRRANVGELGEQANAGGTFDIPIPNTSVSRNGRFVAFYSFADNLVPGDTNGSPDVFVRDRIHLRFLGTPKAPNPVSYELRQASGETGNLAAVLVSCSGTAGFPLPGDGRLVPITPDACTAYGLANLASFLGVVDASGTATTPPFAFPALPAGVTIHSAAVTVDAATGAFVSITAPIDFESEG